MNRFDPALYAEVRKPLDQAQGLPPACYFDEAFYQRELDTIAGHGFSPLFLVVADIVRYARQHDIPVSTRGSVANSLAAYCAGITTVDPIEHDLLFERQDEWASSSDPRPVFDSYAESLGLDLDLELLVGQASRQHDALGDHRRRIAGVRDLWKQIIKASYHLSVLHAFEDYTISRDSASESHNKAFTGLCRPRSRPGSRPYVS
jgi:hypothetical protein